MEKLVYILWKRLELSPAELKAELLGKAARRLRDRGALRIEVNLADEFVEEAQRARLTRLDPPLDGMLAFWLDSADERGPLEEVLREVSARMAGYLVVESVPLRNTTYTAPPGSRIPGINMLACIEKPDWIDDEAWIEHWHGEHRKVALETQATYLYVRNVVVRALTPDAPPWRGIVEEGFPSEAPTDPRIWYDAGDSQEELEKRMARMIESCRKFLDLDRVESHPLSQYVLEP